MKSHKLCANISTLLKKRLLLIITGVVLCCSGVWGATITWTGTAGDNLWDTPGNWDTGAVPGASDTVIINGTQTITMPNSDIVIDSLTIATTGDSSISFVTQADKKFSITNTTTLNKYKDNASGQTYSAVLNIKGAGTFSTKFVDMPETFWGKEFSINIDENATLELTEQIYANIGETSQFTISGSGIYCPPPSEYNGNKQEISEDVVQKKVNGNWTLSSHALQLGTTTTVEISNSVNQFEKVYADILIINNDTTTTEEYKINGTTITTSTDINLGSSKNTHTLSISIPATVDSGDVITIDFYADDTKTQKIGNTLFFRGSTPPATTSTWNGGTWDTVPSDTTKNIIIVSDLTIGNSSLNIDFSTNYPALTKLTVRDTATLTSSGNTNFNNIQIINNGTIKLNGSETNITKTSNGSGASSTIIYTGAAASSIWGNSYQNLEIAASASLNLGSTAVIINGDFSGSGTFSASGGKTTFLGNADFSQLTAATLNNGTIEFYNTKSTANNYKTTAGQAFKNLYFSGNGNLILNGNISANSFNLQDSTDGTYFVNENFTLKTSGSGKISTGSANITRCSSTNNVIGTLELNTDFECSGDFQTHSGTTIQINTSKALQTNTYTHSASGTTPIAKLIVNGTLNCTNDIKMSANNQSAKITVDTNGKIYTKNLTYSTTYSNADDTNPIVNKGYIKATESISADNITGEGILEITTGALSVTSTTIGSSQKEIKAAGGTITVSNTTDGITLTGNSADSNNAINFTGDNTISGLFKIQGNWEDTGTLTATGSHVIVNEDASLSVGTTYAFDKFTVSSGKTITVSSGTTISVNEAKFDGATIKASTADSQWTLDPSDVTKISAKSVSVKDSFSTKYLGATGTNNGNTFNWIDSVYTWKGGTTGNETTWATAANWTVGTSTTPAAAPLITTNYIDIIIDTQTAGNDPVLPAGDLSFKTVTINSGSVLDLKDQNLALHGSADTLFTNEGTVKLYGTQTLPSTEKIKNDTSSTVEYYGGASGSEIIATKLFGNLFSNLTVNQYSTLQLGNTSTTVSGTFSNEGTVEINGTGILNATMDTDSGTIKYSGANTVVKDYGTPDYYNLLISAGTAELSGDISAANKIDILSSSTLTADTTLITDSINVGATITDTASPSTHNLTILPSNTNKTIYVGSDVTNEFSLSNTEIGNITVKNLKIGSTTCTGDIDIKASLAANCGLYLTTGGNLKQSQSGAAINTISGELHLEANGNIGVLSPSNPIEIGSVNGIVSAISSGTGDINLKVTNTPNSDKTILGGSDSQLQVIKTNNGSIQIITQNPIEIQGNITSSKSLSLDAQGSITEITGTLSTGSNTTDYLNLTATTGIGTSTAPIEANSSTIVANSTASGGVYINNNASADFTVSTNNADIALKAIGFTFTNTPSVNAGTGTITLSSYTDNGDITLNSADFGKLTANALSIGASDHTGDITLDTGSITLPYPVTFTGKELTIKSDINANGNDIKINTSSLNLSNGSTNGGTLIFDNSNTTLTPKADGSTTFTNITIESGKELTTSNNSTIKLTGDWTNNGTFTAGTDSTIHFAGTSEIKGSSITTFNNVVIDSGKTLKSNATNGITIKVAGNWTNKGTFTANEGTVEFTGSPTLSGNTEFYNLTHKTADKTITVTAGTTQTVTNKLVLKGTNEASKLTLRSSTPGTQWNINCTGSNSHEIDYADIQDSNNTSASYRLTATNSTDSGNNSRWNFTGFEYTWTGSNGTKWYDRLNWTPASIPGVGVNAKIVNATNQPKLEKDMTESIGSTGTITVNSGAILDLQNFSLTAHSITNNGRIKLDGSQVITTTSIINNTGSTVEYYGNCSNMPFNGNEAGKSNYYNLEFTSGATGTVSAPITVANTTLFDIGDSNTLTLSGANTFTNEVTLNSGKLNIASNDSLTIADNAKADSIVINASGKTVTIQGSLNTTGTATLTAAEVVTSGGNSSTSAEITASALSVSGNFTNSGYIKNNAPTSVSGNFVNSTNTYNANNTTSVTGNFTDSALWSSSYSIILNGSENQTFTPNATTTYAQVEINNTKVNTPPAITPTVSFAADKNLNVTNLIISQADTTEFFSNSTIGTLTTSNNSGNISFDKTTVITTFTDATPVSNNGNYIFNESTSIKSDTVITTTGTVSFIGNTTFNNGSADTTITHINGSTKLKGTLKASSITLADLLLDSPSSATGNLIFAVTDKTLSSNHVDGTTPYLLTLNGDLTVNSGIGFSQNSPLSLSGDYLNSGTLNLNNSVILTGSSKKLTNDTNASLNVSTNNISISGEVLNKGTINNNGNLTITGDFQNDSTINGTGDFIFNSNFTDNGSWTNSGTLKFSENNSQEFIPTTDPSSNYSKIIIEKNEVSPGTSSTITFKTNPLKATDIQFIQGNLVFQEPITASSFKDVADNSIISTAGTLTFEANADISSSVYIYSTSNIAIKNYFNTPELIFTASGNQKLITEQSTKFNSIKIEQDSTLNIATEFTLTGNLTNNGTFNGSNSTITFAGTSEVKGSSTTTFNNLIIDSGKTLKSSVTATDGNIIKISGNWTNNAVSSNFDANNGTVEFTGSPTIKGETTFYNFVNQTPNKTITFENGKTQTVTNKLTLKGDSTNKIYLRSSTPGTQWNINCTGSNSHEIDYADIQDSNNTSASYRLTATNSTDSGNNSRWNFTGVEYIWTGSHNSDWYNIQNWNRNSIPGLGTNIIIPQTPNHPVLEHNLDDNLTDEYASVGEDGTITVQTNAVADFTGYSFTTKKITNNGRIRLTGSQLIKGKAPAAAPEFVYSPDSIIEYYGTCSTVPMGNSYQNIEFTNGANGTISQDLTIAGTTLLANGTSNALNLNGANNFTGIITFADTTITPEVPGGILSLNSSTDLTIADNAKADSLVINASGKTVTIQGSLNTTGTATLTAAEVVTSGGNSSTSAEITASALSVSGNFTNSGYIKNNAPTSVSGNFVNSTNTYNANNTTSVTGNFTDSALWSSSYSIILNGSENQNFTSNPNTTYEKLALSNSNKDILFTNSIKITKLTDSGTNKNIVFTENTTIQISGDVIFNTPVKFATTETNTIAEKLTFIGSSISFNKPVTTLTNIEISADNTTLNANFADSISQTHYLKLNGNLVTNNLIDFIPELLLNGSLSGDGKANFKANLYVIGDLTDIELNTTKVTGNLIIDAERNITTKGTITANNIVLYKGNIKAHTNSMLYAEKDIILLGPEYNIENSESGNSKEFIYQQQRLSPVNYLRQSFNADEKRPDDVSLSKDVFSGSYSASSSSRLYAGKNFYANGITLSSQDSSEWFIDISDLTDATNAFAEAVYTTVEYSTVRCNSSSTPNPDGSLAKMPAYFCTDNGNNTNWIFDDFEITDVRTVRDNSLQITFNHPVRNTNNELNDSIARFKNNKNTFVSFHTQPDCIQSNLLQNQNIYTNDTNRMPLYIKAPETWNTDATGTSEGTTASTDRSGLHKTIIPYLEIDTITENNADSSTVHISDIWGKRLKNYSGANRFTNVTDHTGPVLYSVRTGQENHTPYNKTKAEESQPSYDSHNFIEFRYSEKVNFGNTSIAADSPEKPEFNNSNKNAELWLPAIASTVTNNFADIQNVRVSNTFGVVTSNLSSNRNLILEGLGKISNGKLHTGQNGKDDKYVNALYRTDQYSIRLSLAGYTEGTVSDRNGNKYKKWLGYTENALQPFGTVSMNEAVNTKVTDCAVELDGRTPIYNPQEQYADNQTVPNINKKYSDGTEYPFSGIYSNWDISEPVFAPLRLDANTPWGNKDYFEAVGNSSRAGSTLDKIEFHFFDNTPTYTNQDEAVWLSEKGWVLNSTDNTSVLYDSSYTYPADIIGGARQFSRDASNRTTGGIRFSTVTNAANAFKYIDIQTDIAEPSTPFISSIDGVYIGAKASLFTGSSTLRRAADDPDGLYFGLGLTQTDLPISKSFTVSYNEEYAYITDLAGNRLRSAKIRTIDRTPPSFDIILSPISQKEVYIVFVKNVVSKSDSIKYIDNSGDQFEFSEKFESIIPKSFELFTIEENGQSKKYTNNQIDYSVPAKIEHIVSDKTHENFTAIKLTLKENITLEEIESVHIRVIIPEEFDEYTKDPVTGIENSHVTFIQDSIGNYVQMYEAHALSDFAISSINPLYAYDADMTFNEENIMNGLYENGSWAAHDWNAEQQNYGTLPANHPYGLVADITNGTNDKNHIPAGVRLFLSAKPDKDSISKQYNDDFNQKLRIWLPEVTNGLFPALALKNNPVSNYVQIDSTLLNPNDSPFRIHFDISKQISESWGSGQQISFLFGLLNEDGSPLRIYNAPYFDVTTGSYNLSKSEAVPLYSLRLKDPTDITSIDLWSFKTRAITEQRGGVTILNNVINVSNGEKCVVKVNMPSEGKLNVIVMTLDGNIVTYLNHGLTQAGEHYYSWNGLNKNNGEVARGMYFIRVTGSDFDETRKVMVVK